MLLFFFFLMIRRPPRSTLFPTRRSSDLALTQRFIRATSSWARSTLAIHNGAANTVRSEEHTSELQSRQYLVCRLLLEKKKNRTAKTKNFKRIDGGGHDQSHANKDTVQVA